MKELLTNWLCGHIYSLKQIVKETKDKKSKQELQTQIDKLAEFIETIRGAKFYP